MLPHLAGLKRPYPTRDEDRLGVKFLTQMRDCVKIALYLLQLDDFFTHVIRGVERFGLLYQVIGDFLAGAERYSGDIVNRLIRV